MTTQTLNVGDRVRYSSEFLRHYGICTGWMPFARGTIESISKHNLASIRWDDPCPEGYVGGARVSNLEQTRD